jgi:hypothetical protein
MNELVRDGSGVLLVPHHTFSQIDAPVPALGKYGNISASMSPEVGVASLNSFLERFRTAVPDCVPPYSHGVPCLHGTLLPRTGT